MGAWGCDELRCQLHNAVHNDGCTSNTGACTNESMCDNKAILWLLCRVHVAPCGPPVGSGGASGEGQKVSLAAARSTFPKISGFAFSLFDEGSVLT